MRLVHLMLRGLLPAIPMAHREQLRGAPGVQHRGNVAQVADHGLERVLPALACLALGTLLVLRSEVVTGAAEAEVVIAGQDEHVVR